MSLESNGWLLKLRGQWRAAVGLRELVHVLPYSPRLCMVPQTPAHARHVIVWEGKIVPVVDLVAYLEAGAEPVLRSATDRPSLDHLVGIIAYQAAPGSEISLAGMLLGEVPERIRVTDEQACALPESPSGWYQVSISCFEHPDHGVVPILDLPRLFSGRVPMRGSHHTRGTAGARAKPERGSECRRAASASEPRRGWNVSAAVERGVRRVLMIDLSSTAQPLMASCVLRTWPSAQIDVCSSAGQRPEVDLTRYDFVLMEYCVDSNENSGLDYLAAIRLQGGDAPRVILLTDDDTAQTASRAKRPGVRQLDVYRRGIAAAIQNMRCSDQAEAHGATPPPLT